MRIDISRYTKLFTLSSLFQYRKNKNSRLVTTVVVFSSFIRLRGLRLTHLQQHQTTVP